MKSIILTLDYELYGNGSGDVFEHIISPTNKILDIAEEYNAKLTIFFEVIEYWKLKIEWEKGNDMGYKENPIKAIENQLQLAYKKGHDIQLHLHPQWVDAKYENNQWVVNLNEWRLGEYNKEGEFSLNNLLKKGKQTIEKIIMPIDPAYRCFALRAGGYNAQPSHDIVKAMKETGLVIDSSLFPGGIEYGTLSKYDYSSIPIDQGYSHTSDFLEQKGDSHIIELPIVAFPIIRLEKFLSPNRIQSLLRNTNSTKQTFNAKTSNKTTYLAKIKYLFETEHQTWDYCLLPKRLHKKFLHSIQQQNDRNIFVLVGHPKSFLANSNFEYLLSLLRNKYESTTIAKIYDRIKKP